MRFTLEPTVRQLALAFPFLLITLPAAMSADEDKPGPALPPPSLYDVIPPDRLASPAPPVPTSSASTPSTSTPSTSTPSALNALGFNTRCSGAVRYQPRHEPHRRPWNPLKPAPPSVAAKPVRAEVRLVNDDRWSQPIRVRRPRGALFAPECRAIA